MCLLRVIPFKEAKLLLTFAGTELHRLPYGLNVPLFSRLIPPTEIKKQKQTTTSVTSRDDRGALAALLAHLSYLLSPGSALGSFCFHPSTIYIEVLSWILKKKNTLCPSGGR